MTSQILMFTFLKSKVVSMRQLAPAVMLQVLLALPAAAQFEGTISMKVSASGSDMMMTMSIKGDQQSNVMTLPPSAGPMAGMEARTIIDPTTNTATTMLPLPPGMAQIPILANAKGIKTVLDLSKNTGDAWGSHAQIKKLGTSQRIAGLACDDYEIIPAKGKPLQACVAESLGRFVFPQTGGGMGGRANGGPAPAWATAFGGKPGFPLRVTESDGNVVLEVLSVTRAPVSPGLFEIPDGYVDMATLFRRGGI